MVKKKKNRLISGIDGKLSGTINNLIFDKTGKVRMTKIVIKKRK